MTAPVAHHAADDLALELRGIDKNFGELRAVDGVDFLVRRGSVHALLGENGAGKSTLMRIAYGLIPADAGSVRLFGEELRHHEVRRSVDAGAGMVHQHFALVPNLTAAENVALGGRGRFDARSAERLLVETSAAAGLFVPSRAIARDLSIVEQQRLEILKALARRARLLILDEPTAVLPPAESAHLLGWLRGFADRGGSVVLVTHKLREALAVSDELTVLRRGGVTLSTRATEVDEAALARAMFPETPAEGTALSVSTFGSTVAAANQVDVRDRRGIQRVRPARSRKGCLLAAVFSRSRSLHWAGGRHLVSRWRPWCSAPRWRCNS